MPKHRTAYSRYLPVEPDARDWGMHVMDCGFNEVPAGATYPVGKHPDGYMFTWEKGRILREYQLVYVSRGRGAFESESGGQARIEAGTVWMLFPGEWHRYRPLKRKGWDESWIGFDGSYARELVTRFFPVTKPVLHVGHSEELLGCMRSVVDLMESATPGYQQIMAAKTVEALARVRALSRQSSVIVRRLEQRLRTARLHLLQHSDEDVDLETLARRSGMSYSRFRSAFKKSTGSSPRQYHLEIRINKARNLLNQTDLLIEEIADRSGFSSVYYFSRCFKARTGLSPSAYRRQTEG